MLYSCYFILPFPDFFENHGRFEPNRRIGLPVHRSFPVWSSKIRHWKFLVFGELSNAFLIKFWYNRLRKTFGICRFTSCLLNLLFSLMLETLEMVVFRKGNVYFYQISFFVFDVKRCRTLIKREWIPRAKGSPKSINFGC